MTAIRVATFAGIGAGTLAPLRLRASASLMARAFRTIASSPFAGAVMIGPGYGLPGWPLTGGKRAIFSRSARSM